MNVPTTDRAQDPLRALLAAADPAPTSELDGADLDSAGRDGAGRDGAGRDGAERTWARILEELGPELGSHDQVGGPAQTQSPSDPAARRPRFVRRHWQAGLLVAAGAASLALAAGTVLPSIGLGGGGADSSTSTEGVVAQDSGAQAPAASADSQAGVARLESGRDASADTSASTSAGAAKPADPTLVRTASVIVGTDDVTAARDTFVATVQGLGGTIVSETVTAKGGEVPLTSGAAEDLATSYPGPSPSGPGIWLTVKVPAAAYDQVLTAARAAGTVAQLQQSSYDVGAQVTDTRARIVVLTASLKRLESLLGQAKGVSDVIRLENAITDRQAELDSLLAQQRDLADQTGTSQISLTLLSPEDAAGAVDPDPQLTWWESFVQGLAQFWSWLGQALLILSPLLIAAAVLWWVRRRARRADGSGPTPAGGDTAPEAT